VEDAELAKKGIPNPWDDYPEGRPVRFLRARSKLKVSEDKAEIIWKHDSTQKISEDIKEKQSAVESSGVTWVRENDVLTACLGPEQPGRVRTVSSYTGWKHGWPGCSGMYRKRKRSGAVDVDVEAIAAQVRQEVTAQVTQEVTAKVTQEVTSKVTQDVMSYLADQGLLVRPPPSRTLVLPADEGAVVPLPPTLFQTTWSWGPVQLLQILLIFLKSQPNVPW
jgi:hypothetical protein